MKGGASSRSHPALPDQQHLSGVGAAPDFPLPSWADNTTCRVLLSLIAIERPDYRVGDACGFKVIEYRGVHAAKLRRYFHDLLDTALAADDAAFFAGRQSDEFAQLLRQGKPDDLIHKLLNGGAR